MDNINIENIFDSIEVREKDGKKNYPKGTLHLAFIPQNELCQIAKLLDATYEKVTGKKTLPRKYIEAALTTLFMKHQQEFLLIVKTLVEKNLV